MKEGRIVDARETRVHHNSTSSHTLFDARLHLGPPESLKPFRLTVASTRRQHAGTAFLGGIRQAGASTSELALRLHVPTRIIEGLGDGTTNIDPASTYRAATSFVYEEVPEMRQLQTIVAEERLMRTLNRKGITIGRATQFLRLQTGQTRLDFAAKGGLSDSHLGQIELGRREPALVTLNQIISAAGLDASGMPAQQHRLLVEHTEPMSLTFLQTCTYAELFKYLRQLKGFSQKVLANKMEDDQGKIDQSTLKNIEKGRIIRPKKVETFIKAIELDPKSELATIIRTKAQTPLDAPAVVIPHETIQGVFSGELDGQFLFAENLLEIGSEEERGSVTLLKNLTKMRTQLLDGQRRKVIGALLRKLRETKGLSPRAVTDSADRVTKADLWRIEVGEQVPLDITVAKLLTAMGYDMQTPVAWFFIDTLNLVSAN